MATKIMTQEAGQVLANKIKINQSSIVTINAALDRLNGTGNGSVDKKIADKIAEVVNGAPESFDTLKELSDWISSHSTDATAMNSAIQDNATAISTLETAVSNLESNALTVDAALNDTSENPVQNKAVSAAITTINSAIQQIQQNAYDDSALVARVTDLENAYEPVTASDVESWFT